MLPALLATVGFAAGFAAQAVSAANPTASPAAQPRLQRLLPSEELSRPVHLAEIPGSAGLLAVTEQRGVIRTFRPSGRKTGGVLLDIRRKVSRQGNEEGLLSLAFDPDFGRNRAMFVFYSAAAPRRAVISRFTLEPARPVARPATERIILQVEQPYSNHNGGQLAFGPDGFLYIALGDGGAGGDPLGHGQNRRTLLGAILRIDVRNPTDSRPYRIPADNPFVRGPSGSRGEIWAYGLRNPWRFSFDRATGALYAADVGQNTMEEIDLIVGGGNYGWNIMEGSLCYDPGVGCGRRGLKPPVAEYGHDQGSSVTGGFVYRGRALPFLRGRYLFGDFGSGTIWTIPSEGAAPHQPRVLLQTNLLISSFGEDEAGELYVLDLRGGVFKMVAAD